MSTKLLSETICRKGLMVKCFVALIVFCCSVGEAFAQTDTKVTINVTMLSEHGSTAKEAKIPFCLILIQKRVFILRRMQFWTIFVNRLRREAKIHFVYDEENIDSGKRENRIFTKTFFECSFGRFL